MAFNNGMGGFDNGMGGFNGEADIILAFESN
jgi:hypothetical protein